MLEELLVMTEDKKKKVLAFPHLFVILTHTANGTQCYFGGNQDAS